MSRSGPLMGSGSVTVWSAHGVSECPGPAHGVLDCRGVTVWCAYGVLEWHGLVRPWGFGDTVWSAHWGFGTSPSAPLGPPIRPRESRSGPLVRPGPLKGCWSITVWSADWVLSVIRSWGSGDTDWSADEVPPLGIMDCHALVR